MNLPSALYAGAVTWAAYATEWMMKWGPLGLVFSGLLGSLLILLVLFVFQLFRYARQRTIARRGTGMKPTSDAWELDFRWGEERGMTSREQALVEAVRELIAAPWGTSRHLRAELRVSCAVAAYDELSALSGLTPDEPGIDETNLEGVCR